MQKEKQRQQKKKRLFVGLIAGWWRRLRVLRSDQSFQADSSRRRQKYRKVTHPGVIVSRSTVRIAGNRIAGIQVDILLLLKLL